MRKSTRIVALAVVGIFLAMNAGVGAWAVSRARAQERKDVLVRLHQRAQLIASGIGQNVQEDIEALKLMAGYPGVRIPIIAKRYSATDPYLSLFIRLHPRIVSAAVYDSIGRLSARYPFDPTIEGRRFSQQEYFSAAREANDPHISSLFIQIGRPKVAVIAYSYRIPCVGVCGVLVATTPITAFDAMTVPNASAGIVVRVYNSSGERISPSSEASARSYASDLLVGSALKGHSSTGRSGSSVSAAAPVPPIGWAVVVSQPASSAFKDADKLTVKLAAAAAAMTLLAIGAAFLASRRAVPAPSMERVQETERSLDRF